MRMALSRKLVNLKSMIVVTNGVCVACLIDTTRRYAKADGLS
jgi:hypothetical protein